MPRSLHQNKLKTFPVRERLIPNLGTLYSHLGNVSFPYWEYYKNTPQRSVEFLDEPSGIAERQMRQNFRDSTELN